MHARAVSVAEEPSRHSVALSAVRQKDRAEGSAQRPSELAAPAGDAAFGPASVAAPRTRPSQVPCQPRTSAGDDFVVDASVALAGGSEVTAEREPGVSATGLSGNDTASPTKMGKRTTARPARATLDPATRADMQSRFGVDFGGVRIDTSESAGARARELGVRAYTEGDTIAFAAGSYAPATHEGRHVLAHELAHVVQQQRGLTRGLTADSRLELEAAAQKSAQLVEAGVKVPAPVTFGAPAPVLQTFDPEYHEQATMTGLTGIFTPQEIGKIYEGNWRRDFSQSSPLVGDLVLTWKQLRDGAAATGKADPALQWKLLKIVNHPLKDFLGESYGGYQSWEHMDNPGAAAGAEADARWGNTGKMGELPGYLLDARAAIKDRLATAVRIARSSWGGQKGDSGRELADVWARGTPPADYDMTAPYAGRTRPPAGYGVPKAVPDPSVGSSIIASEVQTAAAAIPGALDPSKIARGFASDPEIADDLGRASHLIEDFFAHSNFVELAAKQATGTQIAPSSLKTGTFETPDKLHSLSGKLRDAADEIDANKSLIPLVGDAVVSALRSVASAAEFTSDKLGPAPGSHTRLAKDSPHATGFAMAHDLATHADQMVFFWVHRIMQDPDADAADKKVYILYQLIDAIINVPSDTHPLHNVYAPVAGGPGQSAP